MLLNLILPLRRSRFSLYKLVQMKEYSSIVLDGKSIAKERQIRLQHDVSELIKSSLLHPKLAIVVVGQRPDSLSYVKAKSKMCAQIGILTEDCHFDEGITERFLLETIISLNARNDIDGILVQLPLPRNINKHKIIQAISPEKDVDGLHPYNTGRLVLRNHVPYFLPCTALGCLELIDQTGVSLEGKTAVVIGRSDLVGNPIATLLKQRNATVIQCHSYSKNLSQYVAMGDIVVTACGCPNLVQGSWLKPGCIVIDVGINYVPNKNDDQPQKKYDLVGDVQFDVAKQIAGYISPVPGGVGPMTIQMLMENTIDAFRIRIQKDEHAFTRGQS